MDAALLSGTFVDLADTLVADFDVIDFLQLLTDRSTALLGASAAGVVLADPRGQLRVAAASSEAAGLVELFQIQNDQGPCLDCYRTGQPVTVTDLTGPDQPWPRFAATTGLLSPADLRLGQALADVATIGLLQERSLRRSETAAEQLQAALNSRVVIEQARGKLAERYGLDMDQAFRVLREHARNTNQRLTDLARRFVNSPGPDFPPPARQQPPRS
jgi:ANTAR domain/GAF domain